MEQYELMKRLVAEVEEDVRKAAGGNKAAGTRARKKLQEVRKAAQLLRTQILESREEGEATPPPAQA